MEEEGSVWKDIVYALNDWLNKITILKEGQRKVSSLQEQVHRTLQQIQQDGLISIYDFCRLQYIGEVWIDLINLSSSIKMEDSTKRLIKSKLLQLYESDHISTDLLIDIIVQLEDN